MTTRFTIERADNGGYIVFADSVRPGYANYPAAALTDANSLLTWLRFNEKSPLHGDITKLNKELERAWAKHLGPGIPDVL